NREYLHRVLSERAEATAALDAPFRLPEALDAPPSTFGTVGCVVLDLAGNLAAGTSTGGLTAKSFGRIGDSPIIGAGTFANNATCGVSATGVGEEFIRHSVARDISARLEYLGESLTEAANHVVHEVLREGEGGVICVGADGELALVYNTPGMLRAAANSDGRFEVCIWEEPETLR
ncbi:MAG: isoaspartyl peptidase/L-asparaginase, partial [Myxococcales bacterium]|nr:isoaspartyl peptidase/L-asparaginase [Myxococcales bacterium]